MKSLPALSRRSQQGKSGVVLNLIHGFDALSNSGSKLIQRGVTSIEYALIASLIAVIILGALAATGDANESRWSAWTDKVVAALRAALGN